MESDPLQVTMAYGLGALLFIVGLETGHLIGQSDVDFGKHTRAAQIQNEQLRPQLSETHKLIAHLIVNEGKHKYSFTTVSTNNRPETCTGDYQLKRGAATLAGDMACTATIPVVK
jgi:hypothetical protein